VIPPVAAPAAPSAPAVTPAAPAVREERPRRSGPGEAFAHYETAIASLKVDAALERQLLTWSHDPAAPVTTAVHVAIERNLAAIGSLRAGAAAGSVVQPAKISPELGNRALVLARLALAEGRCEIDAGLRPVACERAVDVARLGRDLTASSTDEARFLGAVLENEAAHALERWTAKLANEDLVPIRAALARVDDDAPLDGKHAKTLRAASARLAAIRDRLAAPAKEGRTP
jgi:hypothetical protein